MLVYDITDRGTFNSVRSWMAQIADHADAQARTRGAPPRRRPGSATRPPRR